MKKPDEILAEIFSRSPLPNELKMPKKRWERGELKSLATISIIEKYSDYTCEIVCNKKIME